MRKRDLRPQFWSDERLARLPDCTRLLAIGLLSLSDDEGFFTANPALIRGALFPFAADAPAIPRALSELAACGYIRLGTTKDGRAVGLVTNFAKSQRVDKPTPSLIAPLAVFADRSLTDHGLVCDRATPVVTPRQQTPAATSPGVTEPVGGTSTHSAWLEPPPAPVDNGHMSEAEIAKVIRWRIGAAHKRWFGIQPNMPVPDFEQMIAKFLCDGWTPANIVLAILGSWLWTADSAHESTACYSRKCARDLRALAEVSGKEKQPNIWHIRRELIEHGDPDFGTMFTLSTIDEVDEWWAFAMEQRKLKENTAPAPAPVYNPTLPPTPATASPAGTEAKR